MKNKQKYKVIRISKWIFTVIITKEWNPIVEDYVTFTIKEWFYPPHDIFERIKQFFTVKNYGTYTWYPGTGDSLEDTIIKQCDKIVDFLIEWENIDKEEKGD